MDIESILGIGKNDDQLGMEMEIQMEKSMEEKTANEGMEKMEEKVQTTIGEIGTRVASTSNVDTKGKKRER